MRARALHSQLFTGEVHIVRFTPEELRRLHTPMRLLLLHAIAWTVSSTFTFKSFFTFSFPMKCYSLCLVVSRKALRFISRSRPFLRLLCLHLRTKLLGGEMVDTRGVHYRSVLNAFLQRSKHRRNRFDMMWNTTLLNDQLRVN